MVDRLSNYRRMRHGAHRALVAWELLAIGMDVDGLDRAGKGDQQDTQPGQGLEG